MLEKLTKKQIILLIALTLLPTLTEFITTSFKNYAVGIGFRLIIHIVIPVWFVMSLRKTKFKETFLIPLKLQNKKATIYYSVLGSVGAIVFILGAFLVLGSFLDFSAIALNLREGYNVTTFIYPFIALGIVLFNPFLEEYFWRGFIFRAFYENSERKTHKVISYLGGIFFALHHMIIIWGWFNWWQWIMVTVFLASVGVFFNWLYVRTKSIYTSLIIHTVADLVIVIIGFIILF